MSKEISLVKSKFVTYFVNGIGWLAYAVLSLFNNKICSLMASVILLICVVLSFWGLHASNEEDDEMSLQSMYKAKALTIDWFKPVLCLIMLLLIVLELLSRFFPVIDYNIEVRATLIVPIIMGVIDVLVGLLFVKYEKDGE